MKRAWLRAADFAGIPVDSSQIELMERYGHWLAAEAIPAGGIGPAEMERIDRRHLADSVLFASQFDDRSSEVWDLGSGVGLPGIPLAICLPDRNFVLLDRSGRRSDLSKRALRILGLKNCQVIQGDIDHITASPDVIVSRASLPPERVGAVARSHLAPGGLAVIGGSWRERPRHEGWTVIEIPADVLDLTVWLLIMRRQ